MPATSESGSMIVEINVSRFMISFICATQAGPFFRSLGLHPEAFLVLVRGGDVRILGRADRDVPIEDERLERGRVEAHLPYAGRRSALLGEDQRARRLAPEKDTRRPRPAADLGDPEAVVVEHLS